MILKNVFDFIFFIISLSQIADFDAKVKDFLRLCKLPFYHTNLITNSLRYKVASCGHDLQTS
nr:MAG TPA: hypothetical protein [Caudoviricetes sp.]